MCIRDSAKASFKDAKTIVANGEEYAAKYVIIASGSQAKVPPIEGIVYNPHGNSNVLTSTELLSIDHIPEKLCIVGAVSYTHLVLKTCIRGVIHILQRH